MDEQSRLEQAKAAFITLCKTMEHHEWNCHKNEEQLYIECAAQGEDLPMDITVFVDPNKLVAVLLSRLPFAIPENICLDAAVAVSVINEHLVDGCFDFDLSTGNMFFRVTNSFMESTVSEDVFSYMLMCSCATIDEYNDKILMLAKGLISIEQFIAMILK